MVVTPLIATGGDGTGTANRPHGPAGRTQRRDCARAPAGCHARRRASAGCRRARCRGRRWPAFAPGRIAISKPSPARCRARRPTRRSASFGGWPRATLAPRGPACTRCRFAVPARCWAGWRSLRPGAARGRSRGRPRERQRGSRYLAGRGVLDRMAAARAGIGRALSDAAAAAREIELAAAIQERLLPRTDPARSPVQGLNRPIRMVSGDFYDYFERPDGRFAFRAGRRLGQGRPGRLE